MRGKKRWEKKNNGMKNGPTSLAAASTFSFAYAALVSCSSRNFPTASGFSERKSFLTTVTPVTRLLPPSPCTFVHSSVRSMTTDSASKAMPYCNITFIDGEEMKEALSGYLEVLFEQDAASVGGSLPGEDFYYIPCHRKKPPETPYRFDPSSIKRYS